MLDEKKIEEKALEEFPLNSMQRYAYKKGYQDAIKQFLKDLWHPCNEPPKDNTDIVYIDEKQQFWSCEDYSSDNYDDCFGTGWNAAVRNMDIVKWAYKDDLLEQKGGKQ